MSFTTELAARKIVLPLDLRGLLALHSAKMTEFDHEYDYKKRGLKPSQRTNRPKYLDEGTPQERYNITPEDFNTYVLTRAEVVAATGGMAKETVGRLNAVLEGRPSQAIQNPALTDEERRILRTKKRSEIDPELLARGWVTLKTPLIVKVGYDKKIGGSVYRPNLLTITPEERAADLAAKPWKTRSPMAVRFPEIEWVPCGPADPNESRAAVADAAAKRAVKRGQALAAAEAKAAEYERKMAEMEARIAALTVDNSGASAEGGDDTVTGGGDGTVTGGVSHRHTHGDDTVTLKAVTGENMGQGEEGTSEPADAAADEITPSQEEAATAMDLLSTINGVTITDDKIIYLVAALRLGISEFRLGQVITQAIGWDSGDDAWYAFTGKMNEIMMTYRKAVADAPF